MHLSTQRFTAGTMGMNGGTSWRRRRQEAVAMALALATLAAVAVAGEKQETTASSVVGGNVTAVSPTEASGVNVTAICSSTPYPGACRTALSSSASGAAKDPFAASVQFAMARAASARALARNLSSASSDRRGAVPPSGMDDCAELLDVSHGQLGDALAAGSAHDASTWLSAALTNQDTCAHSLEAMPASAGREGVRRRVGALTEFIGTALALHAKLKGGSATPPPPAAPSRTFPSWVSDHDRKLLESAAGGVTPDAVVALDGSGTHRSIGEAIAAVTAAAMAPVGSSKASGGAGRKVIYVKAGRYEESVRISNRQRNVMLMGDGKGKTVIVGHRSAADGYTTYASATVAMFTAQGRTDPNQNTGISIHKCRIAAASDLGDTKVYLGRPWKTYSRTVVMESSLDRSIAAAGWLEWSGQFALNTLYYGEYGNTGPGARTSGRVKWAGVHTSLSTVDATRFTVRNFILGDSWLGDTGVSYTSGL